MNYLAFNDSGKQEQNSSINQSIESAISYSVQIKSVKNDNGDQPEKGQCFNLLSDNTQQGSNKFSSSKQPDYMQSYNSQLVQENSEIEKSIKEEGQNPQFELKPLSQRSEVKIENDQLVHKLPTKMFSFCSDFIKNSSIAKNGNELQQIDKQGNKLIIAQSDQNSTKSSIYTAILQLVLLTLLSKLDQQDIFEEFKMDVIKKIEKVKENLRTLGAAFNKIFLPSMDETEKKQQAQNSLDSLKEFFTQFKYKFQNEEIKTYNYLQIEDQTIVACKLIVSNQLYEKGDSVGVILDDKDNKTTTIDSLLYELAKVIIHFFLNKISTILSLKWNAFLFYYVSQIDVLFPKINYISNF